MKRFNEDGVDISHLEKFNISVPVHAPDVKSFMGYMIVSWGVVILGVVAIGFLV